MAVTKQQVRVYMSERESGHTQITAAAKAGFSERTGCRIEQREAFPGTAKPRHWRTRSEPFGGIWESELRALLEANPSLQAITLLEALQERYPDQYPDKLLRTLQRRVKHWKALHGKEKEVMFRQVYPPGLLGLSDFTQLKGVAITIGGEPLAHRLYHFRLAYSGWTYVKVVLGGESFTALAEGLQTALHRLGGCPEGHRTDSLSAAFKNLTTDEITDITQRYAALCAHYGMRPSRNNPGVAHENGSIESPHGHLKRRIHQALLVRDSHDFGSVSAYQGWLEGRVEKFNRRNRAKIEEECRHLQPLPVQKAADYTELWVRVTSSSTISVRLIVYSVPSRLIGERLRVHLYDDRLVCYLGATEVLTLPRIYASKGKRRARRIDYRHVIGSLVKKPRAFYRSQLRDDLLPSQEYRQIWQVLNEQLEARAACKLMVGVLALAAEHDCEQALAAYLLQAIAGGGLPTLVELQQRFGRPARAIPVQCLVQHCLQSYDELLASLQPDKSQSPQEVAHG
jgi:transposase InsO family protein